MIDPKRKPVDDDDVEADAAQKRQKRAVVVAAKAQPAQAPRKQTLYDLISTTVTIHVIRDDSTFTVHKGLLCQHSKWFESRLREGQTELRLQNVSARTFRMFMVWLYMSKLAPPEEPVEAAQRPNQLAHNPGVPAVARWSDLDLIALYAFGHNYGLRKLKNEATTAYIRQHAETGTIASTQAITCIYELCGPSSGLSAYLAAEKAVRALDHGARDIPPRYEERVPAAFLTEVLRAVAKREDDDSIEEINICRFHEHGDDEGERGACLDGLEVALYGP